MRGQGSDFPNDPNLAESVVHPRPGASGTDEPPAAKADRACGDVGPRSQPGERISALRALVGRLAPGAVGGGSPIPLGLEALDRALGGGLPRAALHVVAGAGPVSACAAIDAMAGAGIAGDGAATGFAAFLLGRLQRLTEEPLLWLPAAPDLYGPGLARLGLDTGRLFLAETSRAADRLWAFEQALRTPGLAGVVAELDRIEPKAARRLQLAAETAGTFGLVLQSRRGSAPLPILAATTRWQVAALPGGLDAYGFPDGFDRPRWQLALLRSRLGRPGSWNVEVQHDPSTDRFALAAALCDRAPAPALEAALVGG
jgi:protein ImuA